jgi:gas vesicle protein
MGNRPKIKNYESTALAASGG